MPGIKPERREGKEPGLKTEPTAMAVFADQEEDEAVRAFVEERGGEAGPRRGCERVKERSRA